MVWKGRVRWGWVRSGGVGLGQVWFYSPVAQRSEQRAVNSLVGGSIPLGGDFWLGAAW